MANLDDTIALIRDLLAEMGHDEQAATLAAETTVKDLRLDSLELLEFLMLVDERTGVEVSTDEATFETTVGELAAMVSSRQQAPQAGR